LCAGRGGPAAADCQHTLLLAALDAQVRLAHTCREKVRRQVRCSKGKRSVSACAEECTDIRAADSWPTGHTERRQQSIHPTAATSHSQTGVQQHSPGMSA
jgi:hypothetical protein